MTSGHGPPPRKPRLTCRLLWHSDRAPKIQALGKMQTPHIARLDTKLPLTNQLHPWPLGLAVGFISAVRVCLHGRVYGPESIGFNCSASTGRQTSPALSARYTISALEHNIGVSFRGSTLSTRSLSTNLFGCQPQHKASGVVRQLQCQVVLDFSLGARSHSALTRHRSGPLLDTGTNIGHGASLNPLTRASTAPSQTYKRNKSIGKPPDKSRDLPQ